MKKKIIDTSVDILLIKLFHSESFWLEFGIYVVFYTIVFGCKKGVMILWERFSSKKKENG